MRSPSGSRTPTAPSCSAPMAAICRLARTGTARRFLRRSRPAPWPLGDAAPDAARKSQRRVPRRPDRGGSARDADTGGTFNEEAPRVGEQACDELIVSCGLLATKVHLVAGLSRRPVTRIVSPGCITTALVPRSDRPGPDPAPDRGRTRTRPGRAMDDQACARAASRARLGQPTPACALFGQVCRALDSRFRSAYKFKKIEQLR
jgi:hypothetical protein